MNKWGGCEISAEMKILRWPKARLRRNVIVVVSVTLLGLFGVKIYELRSSFTSIQPTVSSLDGSALKPSDDESVRRDETFTVEQSRIGSSESIEKSSHGESNVSNSDVIQVKSGVDGNPNPNVHLFYYGWYGNPQHDGEFKWLNHIDLSGMICDDFPQSTLIVWIKHL